MYMFRCEVHFAFDRKMHQVLHCILKKAISTFRHNSKVSLFNQNSTFCNNASSFLLCRTLKLDPWPRMAALFSLKALWCSKSNTSWFHFHHVCREPSSNPEWPRSFPLAFCCPRFWLLSLNAKGMMLLSDILGYWKGVTHIVVGWAMTLSVRGATLIWHAFQATLTWKYYSTTLVYDIVLCMYVCTDCNIPVRNTNDSLI